MDREIDRMTGFTIPKCSLVLLLLMLGLCPAVNCAGKQDTSLDERVSALEKKVAELDAQTAPVREKAKIEVNRQRLAQLARERMQKDATSFTRDQLREIEKLYQVANKNWRSEEATRSLLQLISKYDNANRTGCAVLYLGRMTEGPDQEKYLKMAIDKFSDCFYGDGTQVGPYARFCLAMIYKQQGKTAEADALFKELREKYPDAIEHSGHKLVEMIPGQTAQLEKTN